MTAMDQLLAWMTFFALVVVARLLITRPALRVLGPWFQRLADWGVARFERPPAVDPEVEALALYLRRRQLVAQLDRIRRLLAVDETMSATRQIANRLAYAALVADVARIPEVEIYLPPDPATTRIRYDYGRQSSVEVLEIGWR